MYEQSRVNVSSVRSRSEILEGLDRGEIQVSEAEEKGTANWASRGNLQPYLVGTASYHKNTSL